MRSLLMTLLAVSALSGCASIHKAMHPWEGRQVDDYVAANGPPTAVYAANAGGKVYSFDSGSRSTAEVSTNWATHKKSVDIVEHRCSTVLTTDAFGTILQQTQRGDCN